MKKICRVALLILAMAGLSSCLVKVQYYEHEPTHSFFGIGNRMKSSSFEKLLDFTDSGIVFVPDFTGLTPSYNLPDSHLVFYSQSKTSIYIDKAILYSGSSVYKKELIVRKEVPINEEFKSFYDGGVYLFGDDADGLDNIWSDDSAILEIYYRIPEEGEKGQLKKMEFKLELKTSPEIAWGT